MPINRYEDEGVASYWNEKYEDEYNEPVKLSVISTYLSRFASKGKVDRARTGREWTYQTIKIGQRSQ